MYDSEYYKESNSGSSNQFTSAALTVGVIITAIVGLLAFIKYVIIVSPM
jgi:hypothetical protein